MTEDALISLETKLSYQDDLLEQLNEVVTSQQNQIHDLEHRLDTLAAKLQDLIDLAAEARDEAEKPPHY